MSHPCRSRSRGAAGLTFCFFLKDLRLVTAELRLDNRGSRQGE